MYSIVTISAPFHPNLKEKVGMKRSIYINGENNLIPSAEKSTGKKKVLVLLIKHTDKEDILGKDKEYYRKLLFSNEFGSLKHYLQEISYGKLDIEGEVGEWVVGSKQEKYYGENENIDNISELVYDVMKKSDAQFDYKKYDIYENGYIDYLIVVHSGIGEELTGANENIRTDTWQTNKIYMDGVIANRAIVISNYVGMGIFAHEFLHMMGLPDVYSGNIDDESYIGRYSVMDKGCWNGLENEWDASSPSHPSAYEKSILGWIKIPTISNENIYAIESLDKNETKNAYRICIDESTKEYIVLEYREQVSYDQSLPGRGGLAYKVFEGDINGQNIEYAIRSNKLNEGDIKRYFLLEANGANSIKYNYGDELDFFLDANGNTEIVPFASKRPNTCASEQNYLINNGIEIKNIDINDGVMQFEINKHTLDLNRDNKIDYMDIKAIKANYNNYKLEYDLYGDKKIDFKDIEVFSKRYSKEVDEAEIW